MADAYVSQETTTDHQPMGGPSLPADSDTMAVGHRTIHDHFFATDTLPTSTMQQPHHWHQLPEPQHDHDASVPTAVAGTGFFYPELWEIMRMLGGDRQECTVPETSGYCYHGSAD